MDAREIIEFYLEQGILLSPELLKEMKERVLPISSDFAVITEDILKISEKNIPINTEDFEKSVVLKQKHHDDRMYVKFLEYIEDHQHLPATDKSDKRAIVEPSSSLISDDISQDTLDAHRKAFMEKKGIRLVMDYSEKSKKRTVSDFVNYYASRYRELEKILHSRQELQNPTSISRINMKREKENVSLIGFVYDKSVTKNNNIMFTIEDPTGFVKVVVTQAKEELFQLAQEIQLDEIIGITGMYDKLIFANNILIPDVQLTKELKKSVEEGYFLVIADTQVGNKLFLEKEFRKLISWMNGQQGSDAQKDIASKIKYLFIVGDLVDGVGIYPDQEYDLNIIDINDQYKAFAEYLKLLPPELPIIISPGNHDVGRLSEPQPRLHDEYSKPVWMLPNVIPVSNPSIINIFADGRGFEGFDVLLYHGASFVYYGEHIPSIRQKGSQKRPDLIMRYLLQRRHLAPSHTSTLYIPDSKKDNLAIGKVPDFFFSGHIHRASVNNYRNVTCINASCWVAKSDEQERRGLEPQPARAFIVNMQTREIKIMNFLSKEAQERELASADGQ